MWWSGGNTFRRFVRGICRLQLLWATRVALPTLDSLGCPASRASIIIVMTSTLLSAGSGRNPARDGPTRPRAGSVKYVCVCVTVCFFLRAQGLFSLRALSSPRESWSAVELLDISCAYSLADEVAGSPLLPRPCNSLQRQISIRFGSYFYSVAAAAARQVRAGGFKRLKLRIRLPCPPPPSVLST